jgi:hypothetical protein
MAEGTKVTLDAAKVMADGAKTWTDAGKTRAGGEVDPQITQISQMGRRRGRDVGRSGTAAFRPGFLICVIRVICG